MSDASAVPVTFDAAFEGLLRTFGERITPGLKAQIREKGVDLDKLLPAYPVHQFEETVKVVASAFYPGVPAEEAWRRTGREFMKGYVQTTLGKAAYAIGKVVGPRRTMERMGRNFRTSGNYLRSETKVLAPTEVQIDTHVEPQFLPALGGKRLLMTYYRVGVLEGTLDLLGGKDAEVTIESWDLATQKATYRVKWKE